MINKVLIQLEALIRQLETPLQEEEKQQGWTEEKRKIWLNYFISVKLEIKLKGIEYYKKNSKSIIRSLDSHNIHGGNILESACRLENLVHDLK